MIIHTDHGHYEFLSIRSRLVDEAHLLFDGSPGIELVGKVKVTIDKREPFIMDYKYKGNPHEDKKRFINQLEKMARLYIEMEEDFEYEDNLFDFAKEIFKHTKNEFANKFLNNTSNDNEEGK